METGVSGAASEGAWALASIRARHLRKIVVKFNVETVRWEQSGVRMR
jgi:hypothetical protein